jgi:hypothetical protein
MDSHYEPEFIQKARRDLSEVDHQRQLEMLNITRAFAGNRSESAAEPEEGLIHSFGSLCWDALAIFGVYVLIGVALHAL